MVTSDECIMEAVEPKTVWILEMGYEVVEDVITGLADLILRKPRDTTVDRFGTYEEVSGDMHLKHKEK